MRHLHDGASPKSDLGVALAREVEGPHCWRPVIWPDTGFDIVCSSDTNQDLPVSSSGVHSMCSRRARDDEE